jgi:hypothetical protein
MQPETTWLETYKPPLQELPHLVYLRLRQGGIRRLNLCLMLLAEEWMPRLNEFQRWIMGAFTQQIPPLTDAEKTEI